jgi:hypothetical protein
MPKKHPNTVRWGGPGASHEDRTKPIPEPPPAHPLGATSTNPRVSQVSGGGGERDEKHSHVDAMRSSKSHATDSASPTSSEDWRRNRSRRDRAADIAVRAAMGEPRSFGDGAHHDAASPDAPDAGEGTPVRVTCEGESSASAIVAAEAERLVRRAIAPFDSELSEVQIYLTDTSRHGSPGLKSCTIQAMPHRAPPVAVTESARHMDDAVTAAALELVRRLLEVLRRDSGGQSAADETSSPA